MYYTITKTYDQLKAAHRQWRHKGHCHFVHGENWRVDITFGAEVLDEQKFVFDFGGLRPLRAKLEHLFDHTLLIDVDDPEKEFFEDMHRRNLADVRFIPSAGAEGLAQYLFEMADEYIREATEGRVHCAGVVVFEDSRNSARFDGK